MRALEVQQSAFRTPWDRILGVESQVRALRVLDGGEEPMSVRELARRARVQLRSMQVAAKRLEAAGLVERVGTGLHQQVRLNRTHPLAPALAGLFAAERERVARVFDSLKRAARKLAEADAVWIEGPVADGADTVEHALVVSVLAKSGGVDRAVDALRSGMGDLMKREDLTIEVRGWTRADLEALGPRHRGILEAAIPLSGAIPLAHAGHAGGGAGPRRSHATADQDLLRRGARAAAAIAKHPELIAQTRRELARRLESVRPQEARTLREWQQLLDGLSPQRLRRFLVDRGEQATRLRQSMPLTLLSSSKERSGRGRAG